ncbi:M20/M25/M40 family metallo-hydrolase [Singulisphaera sp. PoT]|uniref:M20/M25/M40 family metallo-hydrolase n=1 Tax=Singulisphaera sp. PoT TaxID=3411797 RepID=UPI003BF5B44E
MRLCERWGGLRGGLPLALAAWSSLAGFARAEEYVPGPAEVRIRGDVSFLADDKRAGRAPGTDGIEAAADYIATAFKDLGLKPAPGAQGYFQPFTISGFPSLGPTQELALSGPDGKSLGGEVRKDFTPLAIGVSGSFENAPIVFAGYGITASDPSKKLDYDDYAGVDVKGKVVLLLRREPQQDKDDSPFDGKRNSPFAAFRHKATNAFQHGAAAILLVNDHYGLQGKTDTLLKVGEAGDEANSTIPFISVTRAFADKLLADAGEPNLEQLESQIDAQLKPKTRELKGWTAKGKVEIQRKAIETKNVIGVLEGSGPLADETIVIGAHYDHLGHGGLMSGSLAFLSTDIHNGADDNASGTAMVVEMARRLSKRADPLPRRVVFMAFSGEERGLLGSKYYVEHPLIPLSSTVMMVNFDMVGRLNEKQELTVYGTGTTPGIDALVDALGKSSGFTIKKIAEGLGPSDQQSFYLKNIPVLFAFTGTHRDYHRPSDDTERINFAGMSRIADFAELVLLDIVRRPQRPEFTKVVRQGSSGGHGDSDPGRVSISAYLGSIPDYDDSVKGVKLSGVREGSPAEKGGLKGGDIVIGFGGKPVATIYDYTESLGRYKPGDVVDVVVQRDGKETTLKITLGSRPSETP